MTAPSATARRRHAGFTLLEILAVVAIFGLVAGIVLPNFSTLHSRAVDNEARSLVAQIELARQRAIVTGVAHRLFIDLDAGEYRVEWLGAAEAEDAEPSFEDRNAMEVSEVVSFDLVPPRIAEQEYVPLVGKSGRMKRLDSSIVFAAVETDGGWTEEGESSIVFEQDGSAEPTSIVLEHTAGISATLEILPLASRVRVVHEAL